MSTPAITIVRVILGQPGIVHSRDLEPPLDRRVPQHQRYRIHIKGEPFPQPIPNEQRAQELGALLDAMFAETMRKLGSGEEYSSPFGYSTGAVEDREFYWTEKFPDPDWEQEWILEQTNRLTNAWRAIQQSGDDPERIKTWRAAEENNLQILWEERTLGPTTDGEPSVNIMVDLFGDCDSGETETREVESVIRTDLRGAGHTTPVMRRPNWMREKERETSEVEMKLEVTAAPSEE